MQSLRNKFLALALVAVAFGSAATAATIFNNTNNSNNLPCCGWIVGQYPNTTNVWELIYEFPVQGGDYSLDSIGFLQSDADPNNPVSAGYTVSLYSDAGGVPGAPLESWQGILGTNSISLATSTSVLHPTLSSGQNYWFGVTTTNPLQTGIWITNPAGYSLISCDFLNGNPNSCGTPQIGGAFLLLGTPLNQVQVSWLGGSSVWSDSSSWSLGFVPSISDDVVIYSGGMDQVTLDTPAFANSLTLGGPLNGYQSVLSDYGGTESLTVANTLDIEPNGIMNFWGVSTLNATDLVNRGVINLDGSSTMTVSTLTNDGFLQLKFHSDTLNAGALTNNGTIAMWVNGVNTLNASTLVNNGFFAMAADANNTLNASTLINNGSIDMQYAGAGGAGTIIAGTLTNNGYFNVGTGSALYLTNQTMGITDAVAGSQFDLFGSFTAGGSPGFANLNSVEGMVRLYGQSFTITPGSGTLTIAGTGDLEANFNPDNSALSNITINGNLLDYGRFSTSGGSLTLANSLVNNGYIYVSTNSALYLTNQPMGITDAVAGSQFDLYGAFTAGGNPGFSSLNSVEGTVRLYGQNLTITPGSGTLTVAGTGDLEANSNPVNSALSNITINGNLLDYGRFSTSGGSVNVTGSITVDGSQSMGVFSTGPFGDFVTTPTLNVQNEGIVYVSYLSTLQLTNQPGGITDVSNAAYQVDGTFTTGTNPVFANLTSVGAGGEVYLGGQQYTITPLTGTLTVAQGGKFELGNYVINSQIDAPFGDDITIAGNIDNSGLVLIQTGYNPPSKLTVNGSFTNNPGATFSVGTLTQAFVGSLVNFGTVSVRPGVTLTLTNQPLGITDIAAGSSFSIFGNFLAGANSAFSNLSSVEGTLFLQNGQTTNSTPMGGILTVSNTGAIHILNNSTFQVNGNIDNYGYIGQDPSTLIVSGALTNEPGSTFNLMAGDFLQAGSIVNKGPFDIPGGSTVQTAYYLSGDQTTIGQQATLLVGTGSAANTGYYQLANGTLGEFIDMNGFGVIVVGPNDGVNLGGTLDIQLASGFIPVVGSTYDIITFTPGSLNGTFSGILNSIFNSGTEKWVLNYSNSGGYVQLLAQNNVTSVPEPGTLSLLGAGLVGAIGLLRRIRFMNSDVLSLE